MLEGIDWTKVSITNAKIGRLFEPGEQTEKTPNEIEREASTMSENTIKQLEGSISSLEATVDMLCGKLDILGKKMDSLLNGDLSTSFEKDLVSTAKLISADIDRRNEERWKNL